MLLTNKTDYTDPKARKDLVDFLSHTIEGHDHHGSFEPYMPNERDDFYWTLDSNNNWKVKFFPDQPKYFEIIYRYQCAGNPFEEALAGWLKVRIRALPVGATAADQPS